MQLIDLNPQLSTFREDALSGLLAPRKAIPPKYFYDQKGSELFERICELEEYYVTRTELSILRDCARDAVSLVGERAALFEFGSGASLKTRLLLSQARDLAAYLPIDISKEHLGAAAEELRKEFPAIPVVPICADFTRPLTVPSRLRALGERNVGFFPGSTIGNLDPVEACYFLRAVGDFLGPRGGLLVGVDLVKELTVLERAYNDHEGVTAAFNLNLLNRMNRELGADFDLSRFEHLAFFNSDERRIEMHLVSSQDQLVNVAGRRIGFRKGESIHTESSYKYTPAGFEALAREAGFRISRAWTDPRDWFGVYFLELQGEAGAKLQVC